MNVSGTGGRYIIERKGSSQPERATLKPEDLLPPLRDVLENHRLEIENGVPVEDLAAVVQEEHPSFDTTAYGFQQFSEFLNYAQDKTVVRMEPHEEQGVMMVYSRRGVLSAGRAARSRAAGRRGGRRRGRGAAALRGRPADHLRAESAAGQTQESSGAQTRRPPKPAGPAAVAPQAAVRAAARSRRLTNGHRTNRPRRRSRRRGDTTRRRCAPEISFMSAARVPSIL